GSYSLRSGCATTLFNAGYNMLAVKWFRCCRSDEVEGYIRFGGRLMEELAAE
ncbi:hypothetical protein PHYSODRAFT_419101, partial [Phytophthora sojae]